MDVLHLLWDGSPGEAQRYVEGLVTSDLWAGVRHRVCLAGQGGWLAGRLEQAGFTDVVELGLSSPWLLHRLRQLPTALAGWQPDVVHVHCDLPALALLATRFGGARLVFSEHGDGLVRHGKGLSGLVMRRLTGPLWDAVLTSSYRAARALSEQVPCLSSCLVVLPTPLVAEVAGAAPPPSGRERVLSAFGPVHAERGLAHFLDAAYYVRSRRDDVTFAIHGDGRERLGLVRQASRLGLTGDVLRFEPDGHDDAGAMSRSWATVVPSRVEACGLTALTSLATGTPVIGSTATGLEEVVRHGEEGLLVPAGDAAGLARVLLEALDDPRGWDAMASRARRRAECFDLDTHLCALEVIYSGELVGSEFDSHALDSQQLLLA